MDEERLQKIEAVLAGRHSLLPLALHDGWEEEECEDGNGDWITRHHRYHALRGRCRQDHAMTPNSYEVGRIHGEHDGRQIAALANAVPDLVAEVRRLRAGLAACREVVATCDWTGPYDELNAARLACGLPEL